MKENSGLPRCIKEKKRLPIWWKQLLKSTKSKSYSTKKTAWKWNQWKFIKEKMQSYYITTARRILFSLLPKLKTELEHLIKKKSHLKTELEHLIKKKSPNQHCYWKSLQKIGMDIFTLNRRNYLATIDYFSHYIEIACFIPLTSTNVILIEKYVYQMGDLKYSDQWQWNSVHKHKLQWLCVKI